MQVESHTMKINIILQLRKLVVFVRKRSLPGTRFCDWRNERSTVWFCFHRDMKRMTLYRRNQRWLTREYKRSIDFASEIAPVLFCDVDRYVSIVDLGRSIFQRKLISSINDVRKLRLFIPMRSCCLTKRNTKRFVSTQVLFPNRQVLYLLFLYVYLIRSKCTRILTLIIIRN